MPGRHLPLKVYTNRRPVPLPSDWHGALPKPSESPTGHLLVVADSKPAVHTVLTGTGLPEDRAAEISRHLRLLRLRLPYQWHLVAQQGLLDLASSGVYVSRDQQHGDVVMRVDGPANLMPVARFTHRQVGSDYGLGVERYRALAPGALAVLAALDTLAGTVPA